MMEVVINGVTCPVKGTLPVSLNFQVNTLQTLKDRKGAFSKSVVIPGSPEVDRLFTHIYDIHIDVQNDTATQFNPDFNANIKTPCYVFDGGSPVVVGFCRLMQINRVDQDLINVEYTVQITGDNADLFTLLDKYYLTDLDLSAYDHTYNYANVTGSWGLPFGAGSGYVYPMIDHGQNNTITWNLSHFYPAFFAKQYIDTMFELIARQYDSSFFTASPFDRLIVPFNREKLMVDSQEAQNRWVWIQQSTPILYPGVLAPFPNTQLIFDTEVTDINNQYTDTGANAGIIITSNAGVYAYELNLTVSGVVTFPGATGGTGLTLFARIYSGATTYAQFNLNLGSIGSIGQTFSGNITINTGNLLRAAGAQMFFEFNIYGALLSDGGSIDMQVDADSYFQQRVTDPAIVEGSDIQAAWAVPQNIKCSDFLMWLCQLFNLMLEPKRDNPNVYVIEPARDFYVNDSVDMTDRLDVSKPLIQKPVGTQTGKKFTYRYKADTDYHNKLYSDTYGEVYGSQTVEVINDFNTNEQSTEVGFSPTPLVGYATHDRVLSAIVTGNVNAPTKHNIRLLYYGGLTTTATNWTLVTALSGAHSLPAFPYAGHLDNVAAPTLDLCFGVPQTVYYATTNYTDGNLYNVYHADFVQELTSPSGKFVEAQFSLRANDISTLTFRKLWYVMGAFFRLQSIEDYDPVTNLLCRVKLLKVKRGVQFSARTTSVWSGSGGESAPTQAVNTDVPTAVRNQLSGNTETD